LGGVCVAADRAAPLLGGIEDLEAIVDRHGVRCVVVTFSSAGDDRLVDIVRRCWRLEVPVLVVPRLFEVQSHRTDLHRLGRLPLQPLAPPRSRSWGLRAKYAVDRGMAAVAVVALAPLLIAIAASIRLTLGSPVLFRQLRVGCGGRTFEMLKFRTLETSAETRGEADYAWAAATLGATSSTPVAAAAPRCTRLGAFLRRMSLDELPQFINVLKGEMSLIGPRPERLSYVQLFEAAIQGYSDRHRMKVGLTGWAQVHGLRGDTSLLDRVEWDNAYIDAWSPWLDMRILCRTLKAVLRSPADAARRPSASATPGAPPGQLQAGARGFIPAASEPDARRAQPEGVSGSASSVQPVGATAGRTEPY
jgi:exopolysaccharide biosynthesis polyprenyl glycosylphosphotransferase